MAFRTTQREFAIALKPHLLRKLLETADSALFLDPDLLVVGRLDELFAAVSQHALTLVPHALCPPDGPDAVERDLRLQLCGAFNGGVIGMRREQASARFLDWWQRRVDRLCVYAPERGMHYDQRWLDLALGFVEDLHVHRDVGADVAHWNLRERPIRIRNGVVTAGGEPCRLFHFSGFEPDRPEMPTRYRLDLRFDELGEAQQLFRDYTDVLRRCGWDEARDLPYAYDFFDNGVRIPTAARRLYADLPRGHAFDDPFDETFFEWLREGTPSRLWLFVHRQRPDLQRAFPNPQARDRRRFLAWTRNHGASEHEIPPELV